jgi:hypothetical protein
VEFKRIDLRWVHTCNYLHLRGRGRRIMSSRPDWAVQQDPVSKKQTKKVDLIEVESRMVITKGWGQ